ncbi:MAG: helix-hairpin-helix domain-containing protein [Alistipes sp.]
MAGTVVGAPRCTCRADRALDIRLGDRVYVEKGGEIIPKITGVDLSSRPMQSEPFHFITHCPCCGTELVKYEGEARHYCPNQSHCPPQIVGRMVHFISRKAMNIDGLGDETVQLLYDAGLISDVADLYRLRREDLVDLPRLGDKSADNILRSIDASREVPFQRVLFAIGIRFVGETTAKNLALHFRSMDALMSATPDELAAADEVGGKIALSIVDYFRDEANREIVARLRESGLRFEIEERELLSNALDGLRFVISGTFSEHRAISSRSDRVARRSQPKRRFGQYGLSARRERIGPAKLNKARKLGVRIIGEEDFVRMLSGDMPDAEVAFEDKESLRTDTDFPEKPVDKTAVSDQNNVKQGTLF